VASADFHDPACPVCGRTDEVWPVSAIVQTDTEIPTDEAPGRRSRSFMANVLTDREFRDRLYGKPDRRTKVSDLARQLEFPPIYVHHRSSTIRALFSAAERQAQIDREKEHFHRPCERWLAAYFCRRDTVAFWPDEGRPVAPADFQGALRDGAVPGYEFQECSDEILGEIRRLLLDAGWEYLGQFPTRYSLGEERRFRRHLFRRPAAW
jgi:hypothetical protein